MIVGSAYVAVRAITDKINGDINSAMSGLDGDMQGHGRRHGEEYSRGFSGGTSSIGDTIKNRLRSTGDAEGEGRRAGSSYGGGFGSGISSGLSSAGNAITAVAMKFTVFLPIISAVVSALSSLVSALFAVVSAAGPAAAALGAFAASGISVIAQVAGTLGLGFSGIGKAVGAINKQATAATGGIGRMAGASGAAAAAAQRQAAAARAVESAERNVTKTLQGVKAAQEGLNRARVQAREALQQLRFEVEQGAIDEDRALLNLEEARRNWQVVKDRPTNTTARREGELDLKQAELDYKRAKDRNGDLKKEKKAADKAGVEGSEQVKAAKQQLADAEMAHADAVRSLNEALESQKNVMTGIGAAAGGAAGGIDQVALAMARLSPEAQSFARYLASLSPEFEKLRASAGREMFPKMTTALKTLVSGLFPTLNQVLVETGDAIGDVAIKLANAFTKVSFLENFRTVAGSNVLIIRDLGKVLANLVEIFASLLATASPFIVNSVEGFKQFTNELRKTTLAAQESGKLSEFWQKAWDVGRELWALTKAIAKAIGGVASAASGPGRDLIRWMTDAVNKWSELNLSTEGKKGLADQFQKIVDNAKPLISLLMGIGGALFRVGADPAVGEIANVFKDRVMPALEGLGPQLNEVALSFANIIAILAETGTIDAFVDILNTALPILTSLLNVLRPILPAVGALAAGFLALKLGMMGVGKVTSVGKNITDATKASINFFKRGQGWDGLRLKAMYATDAVKKYSSAIKNAAKSGIGKVKQVAAPVGQAVKTGATNAGAFAKSTGQAAAKGAKQGLSALGNVFKSAGTKAANAFKGGLTIAMKGLSAAFTGIAKAAGPAAKAIKTVGLALKGALMNPVGLVIIAIVALVAALVILYKKNEAFRNFINKAWAVIKNAFIGAWNAIKPAIMALWEVLKKVGEFVGKVFIAYFKVWWTVVSTYFKLAWGIIKVFWNIAKTVFTAFWNILKAVGGFIANVFVNYFKVWWAVAVAAFNAVKNAVMAAWNFIKPPLMNFIEHLKRIWIQAQLLWAKIKLYWEAIKIVIRNAVDNVKRKVSGIWEGITSKLGAVWQGIKDKFNAVVNFVRGLPGRISKAASGMWDGIKNAFRGVINTVIGWWNNFGFGLTVPDNALTRFLNLAGKGFRVETPNIPKLASGGTVSPTAGGTLVRVAEAGRAERIEPLDSSGLSARDRAIIGEIIRAAAQRGNPVIVNNYYPKPERSSESLPMSLRVARAAAPGL